MNKTVFFSRRISVQSFTFQPLENLNADKKYQALIYTSWNLHHDNLYIFFIRA